jgi:hypothetical protein
LLYRKPGARLGIKGSDEVKAHPWFQGFDWVALKDKTMVPTFIPDINKQNFDNIHVNLKGWNDSEEVAANQELLDRRTSKRIVFQDYYFDPKVMASDRNYNNN